jgi:hypothetical protein
MNERSAKVAAIRHFNALVHEIIYLYSDRIILLCIRSSATVPVACINDSCLSVQRTYFHDYFCL